VYWDRHQQWDYFKACMQGSSYYKLPAVLNWFSGNIGYHHIHHLSAKIPNYNLPKAYRENPIFHIKPLTILDSLRSMKWRLYDEASRRLAGWEVLKKYRPMKM
jgi:omega-6 fatty acid desaturase (delta-12 desaturase)